MQRIAVDAQPFGRFDLHALAGGHHLDDQLALHAVDDRGVEVFGAGAGRFHALLDQLRGERLHVGAAAAADPPRLAAQHGLGQQVAGQLVAGGQHHRPLDVVLQFAHVARPGVILQRLHRGRRHVGHVAVVLLVVDLQEMADQRGNVFAPLAQRRQIDRHHVQAIVEVFAEPPGLGLFQQVAVAGGDHAGVDADGLRVAYPLELVLLQHAQQLDLELGRGGVDFVEEDGAGVGGLETAGAVVDRAGERAAHMAEQLAFQQVFGQGPAIDADERAAAPRAEPVDRLGDQFLARARLAQQQHRGVRAGHLPRQPVDVLHRRPGADQTGDRRPGFVQIDVRRNAGHKTGIRG